MTFHATMKMPDSQQNPWNLYLSNNVEDIFVFLGLKVFDSDNFHHFIWSKYQRVTFTEKPQLKRISWSSLIRYRFRGCYCELDILFNTPPINLTVYHCSSTKYQVIYLLLNLIPGVFPNSMKILTWKLKSVKEPLSLL